MRFKNVVIESFGVNLPNQMISSEEIENRLQPIYERLKLPFGRLELQTGIKTRGYWDIGTRPSSIATTAAERMLQKTKIKKEDIGILIHASVCRDFLEPATASVVHNNLSLPSDCMIYDLSNACLGVVNAFIEISNKIELGQIKAGMVVSGENSGPLLFKTIETLLNDKTLTRKTIKKYIANLTIGSAGVAYMLSHKDYVEDGHLIKGAAFLADTESSKLCQGSGNISELVMETDSEMLMHAGVKLANKTWDKTKAILEWNEDSVDKIIGHQVGVQHRNLMLETLNLSVNKDYSTFETLGNTGSAALPITLAMASENKFITNGDKIILMGIGSGLNSIMLGVEW